MATKATIVGACILFCGMMVMLSVGKSQEQSSVARANDLLALFQVGDDVGLTTNAGGYRLVICSPEEIVETRKQEAQLTEKRDSLRKAIKETEDRQERNGLIRELNTIHSKQRMSVRFYEVTTIGADYVGLMKSTPEPDSADIELFVPAWRITSVSRTKVERR
jgi:hypothetical protein